MSAPGLSDAAHVAQPSPARSRSRSGIARQRRPRSLLHAFLETSLATVSLDARPVVWCAAPGATRVARHLVRATRLEARLRLGAGRGEDEHRRCDHHRTDNDQHFLA